MQRKIVFNGKMPGMDGVEREYSEKTAESFVNAKVAAYVKKPRGKKSAADGVESG